MTTDLHELARLARAATPGPWRLGPYECCVEAVGTEGSVTDSVTTIGGIYTSHNKDAAYIAAASPDVVLALVERVQKAEKALLRIWDEVQNNARQEDCAGTDVVDVDELLKLLAGDELPFKGVW